jgi:uncharacterized protein
MNGKLIPALVLFFALTGSSAFADTLDCSPGSASDANKCGPDLNSPGQFSPAPAVDASRLFAASSHPKVVFQINQAGDGPTVLRFVTNYLIAEPTAEVVVVGYAGGVDFMLKGAKDAAGKPYAPQLQALSDQGVRFRACNNTLKSRNLKADEVASTVSVVPGAVNEIIRLQTREGFAYFRH